MKKKASKMNNNGQPDFDEMVEFIESIIPSMDADETREYMQGLMSLASYITYCPSHEDFENAYCQEVTRQYKLLKEEYVRISFTETHKRDYDRFIHVDELYQYEGTENFKIIEDE